MLKKLLIGCGVLIAACVVMLLLALVYIGAVSPSTAVQEGSKVRSSFVTELRELGFLEPDEELRFFYSDGLLGIREGCYALTDRALVVFVEEDIDPPLRIAFDDVVRIERAYSDSALIDSEVQVGFTERSLDEEPTEEWVFFPLSNEGGGDRRFLEALAASTGLPLFEIDESEVWWSEE